MWSFVVVVESPQPSHLAHLAQRLEQIGVQKLVPERAIEALGKSVLLWLALLDVDELDTLLLLYMAGTKKGACDALCGWLGAGDGNRTHV